eukprot:scaffold2268_cov349-Prasinococcus_capsulatus_cf.AAC.13
MSRPPPPPPPPPLAPAALGSGLGLLLPIIARRRAPRCYSRAGSGSRGAAPWGCGTPRWAALPRCDVVSAELRRAPMHKLRRQARGADKGRSLGQIDRSWPGRAATERALGRPLACAASAHNPASSTEGDGMAPPPHNSSSNARAT